MFSQHPACKQFGISKGLPSSECYYCMQDSRGYLWVATDAGVAKYDGYKFTTYSSSKGLPDNTIFHIEEDRHGRIWMSSYTYGLSYYDYDSDSIYCIRAKTNFNISENSYAKSLAFDAADTLYVAVHRVGYIKIFPPDYVQYQTFFYKRNFYFIKQITRDKSIHGLVAYDLKKNIQTKRYTPLKTTLVYDPGPKNGVDTKNTIMPLEWANIHHQCLQVGDSSFIISQGYGLQHCSPQGNTLIYKATHLRENKHIVCLHKDRSMRTWIGILNGGAEVYEKGNFSKPRYHLLPGLSVTSICQDNNQGYWLTTLENGVYYIPSLDFAFIDSKNGLSSDKILTIARIKNKLYSLSANYTLHEIDLGSYRITDCKQLSFSAWSMASLDSSIVLCQSLSGIFSNLKKNKIPLWLTIDNKRSLARIKKAQDYNRDSIIAIDYGTVYTFSKKTGEGKPLIEGLSMIFSLHLNSQGLWLGTASGVYKHHHGKTLPVGQGTPLSTLKSEDITSVGNNLFFATRGQGVFWTMNGAVIRQFTEHDGLASNMVRCLSPDKHGNIWIGTNRGISLLKKNSYGLYNLIQLNILATYEINDIIENGTSLYFATNSGLGILNISNFVDPDVSIPVYVEKLQINHSFRSASVSHELKHDENFIVINYRGINLKDEGDITYKYRLNGLDTSWTYSKNTYVQYTTLPPGKYRFTVYALNNKERPSEKPAEIVFTISKPFWETWWFFIGTAAIILLGIVCIYKRRIELIKQKEKEKTEINKLITESELKALRAQMNPHFMFNAINSIQNFVLKNDARSAQKYLTKFARLIRSVLENSKYEYVALIREIEALELYVELEALRSSFGFDYDMYIDQNIVTDQLAIPPMLIQPYIENAILHGIAPLTERRGKLRISFSLKDRILECRIEDNGIGRKKSEEIKQKKQRLHESMGMEVTTKRINILNMQQHGHLTKILLHDLIENNVAAGTLVIIHIPIKP